MPTADFVLGSSMTEEALLSEPNTRSLVFFSDLRQTGRSSQQRPDQGQSQN